MAVTSKARRSYNVAEKTDLLAEVNRSCPLCGEKLFYRKNRKTYAHYEIAHIYPLHPSRAEADALKDERRLSEDANDVANLIALCPGCHTKFDKPRTAAEYRELVQRKSALIRQAEQKEIQASYQIHDDIRHVVESLYSEIPASAGADLEYGPKSVEEKLGASAPLPTQQKVKYYVGYYYPYIRAKFLELEAKSPGASDLIYAQVRAFYMNQKLLNLRAEEVFANVVEWLRTKTKAKTIEPAEIVTSFFIQNCEVFE